MARYFNIQIMIQDFKDVTVKSEMLSFDFKEVCPKVCCKENKCILTDNFDISYEFVDDYKFDAKPLKELVFLHGGDVFVKATMK